MAGKPTASSFGSPDDFEFLTRLCKHSIPSLKIVDVCSPNVKSSLVKMSTLKEEHVSVFSSLFRPNMSHANVALEKERHATNMSISTWIDRCKLCSKRSWRMTKAWPICQRGSGEISVVEFCNDFLREYYNLGKTNSTSRSMLMNIIEQTPNKHHV